MLKPDTVLVLGAGASVEFDLPQGSELATRIARKVGWIWDGLRVSSGDERLFQVITAADRNSTSAYLAAGSVISRGLPLSMSIDDFLYNHGSNPHVVHAGKVAIAACILEAEAKSKLAFSTARDRNKLAASFHGLGDTWLYNLFRRLCTGVTRENVAHIFDGLSIINFNYDRCVELFFYYALQVAYSLREGEAQEVMARLDIVHPYGQVGGLPWQPGRKPAVEYGAPAGAADLLTVAEGIKTFTERAHDPKEVLSWKQRVREANQLVLLGFGFHAQNLELLDPGEKMRGPWPSTFATTHGMSGEDTQIVKRFLVSLAGMSEPGTPAPNVAAMTCAQWVKEYGLRISDRSF